SSPLFTFRRERDHGGVFSGRFSEAGAVDQTWGLGLGGGGAMSEPAARPWGLPDAAAIRAMEDALDEVSR
ncbi:MAG: hypothetical protein ABGZ36_22305, partial [Actinomycetota bacterium]